MWAFHLAAWCSENNLLLNASKTEQLATDFRRKEMDIPPHIKGDCGAGVELPLPEGGLTCSVNSWKKPSRDSASWGRSRSTTSHRDCWCPSTGGVHANIVVHQRKALFDTAQKSVGSPSPHPTTCTVIAASTFWRTLFSWDNLCSNCCLQADDTGQSNQEQTGLK